MTRRRATVLAALLVIVAGAMMTYSVSAQIGGKGRSFYRRAKQALDAIDKKYEIDEDGDFKIIDAYEDGRSQIIFVNSATEMFGDMEVREVWAPIMVTEENLSAQVANDLLRDSDRMKIGGWVLQQVAGGDAVVFKAKVAAEMPAELLGNVILVVGVTADEKEKALVGTDDF
jgi:hypothetical protein